MVFEFVSYTFMQSRLMEQVGLSVRSKDQVAQRTAIFHIQVSSPFQ